MYLLLLNVNDNQPLYWSMYLRALSMIKIFDRKNKTKLICDSGGLTNYSEEDFKWEVNKWDHVY